MKKISKISLLTTNDDEKEGVKLRETDQAKSKRLFASRRPKSIEGSRILIDSELFSQVPEN